MVLAKEASSSGQPHLAAGAEPPTQVRNSGVSLRAPGLRGINLSGSQTSLLGVPHGAVVPVPPCG
jgi:hypothetical protein